MSKPYVHAVASAKRFGGKPSDYIKIHNRMDSTKGLIADVRHRAFSHNSWFLFILEELEGDDEGNITNSDGKKVSVREVGEWHIREDFGDRFIPSAQDYLSQVTIQPWMSNTPDSWLDSYKDIKEPYGPVKNDVPEESTEDIIVGGSRNSMHKDEVNEDKKTVEFIPNKPTNHVKDPTAARIKKLYNDMQKHTSTRDIKFD